MFTRPEDAEKAFYKAFEETDLKMIEKKVNEMYSKEIMKYGVKDRRSLFWTKDKCRSG